MSINGFGAHTGLEEERRRSNHKVKGEDRKSYRPTAVHTLIARFNLVKRMFPLGDLSIVSPPSRPGMNEIVTDHATCPTKPDGWARVRWAVNGSFAGEVSYKAQGIFLHVIYPDVEYDRSPVPAVCHQKTISSVTMSISAPTSKWPRISHLARTAGAAQAPDAPANPASSPTSAAAGPTPLRATS